jgi:general secretion pathway protein C
MTARLSAFVIWALVAATAVFWGLRLLVRAPSAPAYVVPVGDVSAVRGDLTRLLGAAPVATATAIPAADANSRFRLFGIMAPKVSSGEVSGHGVALIAVDGKMPKAYAVGARLDGDLMLQSVSLRTVSIGAGQGAPAITLELPPPAAAATGKLPGGGTPVPPLPASPSQIAPQVAPTFVPQPVAPQPQQPVVGQAPQAPQQAAPPPQTARPDANPPTQ